MQARHKSNTTYQSTPRSGHSAGTSPANKSANIQRSASPVSSDSDYGGSFAEEHLWNRNTRVQSSTSLREGNDIDIEDYDGSENSEDDGNLSDSSLTPATTGLARNSPPALTRESFSEANRDLESAGDDVVYRDLFFKVVHCPRCNTHCLPVNPNIDPACLSYQNRCSRCYTLWCSFPGCHAYKRMRNFDGLGEAEQFDAHTQGCSHRRLIGIMVALRDLKLSESVPTIMKRIEQIRDRRYPHYMTMEDIHYRALSGDALDIEDLEIAMGRISRSIVYDGPESTDHFAVTLLRRSIVPLLLYIILPELTFVSHPPSFYRAVARLISAIATNPRISNILVDPTIVLHPCDQTFVEWYSVGFNVVRRHTMLSLQIDLSEGIEHADIIRCALAKEKDVHLRESEPDWTKAVKEWIDLFEHKDCRKPLPLSVESHRRLYITV